MNSLHHLPLFPERVPHLALLPERSGYLTSLWDVAPIALSATPYGARVTEVAPTARSSFKVAPIARSGALLAQTTLSTPFFDPKCFQVPPRTPMDTPTPDKDLCNAKKKLKVRSSVLDAEKDPIKQKRVLRLEAMPKFTKDLDKGKGVVFDFDLNSEAQTKDDDGGKEKHMGSAIRANKMANSFQQCEERDLREALSRSRLEGSFSTTSDPKMIVPVKTVQKQTGSLLVGHSTEYGSTSSEARPSGGPQNSTKIRRRPYIRKRQEQKKPSANILRKLYGSEAAKERIMERSPSSQCL
ncbi:hypothetical protein F2Q68_00041335 [Brassica cretica]|uniref:Uncharacterized protein n=1 Tax=Brassica cretica TaxID=69181 RepID=A0A8S9MFZ3_BRACR|nr:hypothetical protein F2Q68_00041335 [Brassica cretica]